MQSTSLSIEIDAPLARCWEIITDYEGYLDWQPDVKDVETIKRDDQGRPSIVEYTLDVMVKRVTYRLSYEYEPMTELKWHLESGDLKAMEGRYGFAENGSTVSVEYDLALDTGFWVPGGMLKKLNEHLAGQALHKFKERAES